MPTEAPIMSLVVAIAENGVIGREGGLPWRLSTDMKRFKALTMDKSIVMGRKTWESFPKKPLPGRRNIIVTREQGYRADGAEVAGSLDDALALAKRPDACEICIIGGGEIFRQALPLAQRLHVTHVEASVGGEVSFPTIDPREWDPVSTERVAAGEKDDYATRYVVYERRRAGG